MSVILLKFFFSVFEGCVYVCAFLSTLIVGIIVGFLKNYLGMFNIIMSSIL